MSVKSLDKIYNPKDFEHDGYRKAAHLFGPTGTGENYFSLLMPPPNVTGSLHLGHALTYTIQDILVRFHRIAGFDTIWQPGTDHAGIATQMVVARDLESAGIDPKSLSQDEFIDKIWEWKDKSGNNILDQQKALGCSAAWDYSRFTMDNGFCESVIEAFVTLYKSGLIFRDKRLVNWDTKLKTAISDLEIQNKEEKGTLWYIKYRIVDSSDFVTIATTRPETMFGDTAIAVHPDDERYKSLIGKMAIIPYSDRSIPIIADDYIDMEKGTGCLKVTPAHDPNDFAIGKRHDLEMISVIDMDGHLVSAYVPDLLRGLYLKKARKILVEKLTEDGTLTKEEEITHSVPYGDRSGTVVEPLLTEQWFVDAKAMAEEAIRVVEDNEIRFFPDKWKNTYFDWMRHIEPWCISRQIIWGHRIPAWYGPNGEIIVEKTEEEAFLVAEKLGIQIKQLRRETDVLDTWFSSGLWPFATFGWPKENSELLKRYYPTTTLVSGFDIIFFWIARMIMMSLFFMKKIPFKDIYIHALVRDEKGQKMSKSKGNVINPMDLIDEFGADALRFTLAFLSVPGRDIKFGRDHVKISRNFITKIWNAGRFLQSKGVLFTGSVSNINSKLNHWILVKLKNFKIEINKNIAEYRFDYATRNIQYFLREMFCDFFIEAMKFQDDDETKTVAGFVFAEFLRSANPFIPFVTEQLAETLGIIEDGSLVMARAKQIEPMNLSDDFEKEVDDFVELVHEIRSEKQLLGENNEKYNALMQKIQSWPGELRNLAQIVR
ncbi:MAG: valine--tRNA ligase [Holosporales bacterium]|jgi:valyl-tRNA synthetase|nr:valine--tRNA ligase [Holosporales bacterium]